MITRVHDFKCVWGCVCVWMRMGACFHALVCVHAIQSCQIPAKMRVGVLPGGREFNQAPVTNPT